MRAAELNQRAEAREAEALRILDSTLILLPENRVPLSEPTELYNYARLYYALGNDEKGFDMAMRSTRLLHEDLRVLSSTDIVKAERARSGDKVLLGYMQRESNRNKWPATMRYLEQDLNMTASLIKMSLDSPDTMQAITLIQMNDVLHQELGLSNPYLPGVTGGR
jgi:hypothetical protein